MKVILTVITVIFLFATASRATINGFVYTSSTSAYTVPAGKILVLEQFAFSQSTLPNNAILNINGNFINFPTATNGLYTLSKPLFLPAGATLVPANGVGCTLFGVVIDTSDAPLFVGVGSSLGNVAVANNTMTGVVQLSSTTPTKIIIQSSTNLVDWSYDSSVVLQRGSDKTKMLFTAPVSSSGNCFYRAMIRRNSNS